MYFLINGVDYSKYVNSIKVKKSQRYTAFQMADGLMSVDYIDNPKREIEIGFIPLDGTEMVDLQKGLSKFSTSISFIDPATNKLYQNVPCILPETEIEVYQVLGADTKTRYKAFTVNYIQL